MAPTQAPLADGYVWLGDHQDALTAAESGYFAHVLCLQRSTETAWTPDRVRMLRNNGGLLVHIPLYDDERMRYRDIITAARVLLQLQSNGYEHEGNARTLVHCSVGASRTAAVYIAACLISEMGYLGTSGWSCKDVDSLWNGLREVRPVTQGMFPHHYELLTGGQYVPSGF